MSGSDGRPPLADAGARRRATTDFSLNLVVTAGAGAGKTALLVERALNLIGSGEAALENVALVTFTEKAAADLRRRLQSGLDALVRRAAGASGAIDAEEDADRSWAWLRESAVDPAAVHRRALAALRALDGAAIGTIHAFCAEILRRYPREAGVDPGFSIDEGPAFERLFALEWEDYLRQELGPAASRVESWRRAMGLGDGIAAVRDLGRALSSFTLPAAALGPVEVQDPRALLGDRVRGVLETLRAVRPLSPRSAPKMRAFLQASGALLSAFLRDGIAGLGTADSPVALADLLEATAPDPGEKLGLDERGAAKEALAEARELLRALAGIDEEAVGAVLETARGLAARARERLLARGCVSFDGLLRLTRDLLAGHPALRRALARRHRRILVDEFQDTDPLQYEILFFLAEAAGEAAAEAYETDLEPGRLFIVGDPKQSIYRFRGADISAFRRAVVHLTGQGGAQLTLTTSFRSPEPLLGPINALFDGWIGSGRGWRGEYEPPYDPITSARPPGAVPPRFAIWSVPSDGNAEARRAAEAEAIASWIVRQAEPPGANGRPFVFRDVAILLRALTHAGLYAAALRRAGIPFVVEGGKDFYERPEVGDFLAFLRAAANPNDGPAILAVMRSPLGAVPDAELARFAADGGRLDRPRGGLPDLGPCPGVRRVLGLLDDFRERTRGWPPDEIIREVLDGTPLALLHASTHEGAQRLANLRKLAGAAQRHAREGLSIAETLRLAEEEFETAIGAGDSPLADETIDAVRVLSIHKAKGLEYPIVIVPDVGRESERRSGKPAAVAAWLGGGGSGHLALRLPGGRSNAAWALYEVETRRHETAEEKRVFYVACTRARERLILVNSHRSGTAAWRDRLPALGYRIEDGAWPEEGVLFGGLVEHRLIRPEKAIRLPCGEPGIDALAQAARDAGTIARQAAGGTRAPLAWPSGARTEDRPTAGDEARARPAGSASGEGRDRVARLAGLAVHSALQAWLSGGPEARENGSLLLDLGRREARRLARGASPLGACPPLALAVSAEVDRILESFLGSSLPSRLAAAEILETEMPVLFRDPAGRTWTGACDLLFREKGTLVVADFKTDRVTADAAGAAERYREQIRVYCEAVSLAFPDAPPRGEVLFVRTGAAAVLFPVSREPD